MIFGHLPSKGSNGKNCEDCDSVYLSPVTLNTTGRETPYFFTDFRFRAWTVAPRGGK